MTHPVVHGFFGPYRFLSNFHLVNVELDGEIYRSTEHAYQAAKTLNLDERRLIQLAPLPRDARRLGQTVQIQPSWDQLKFTVMYELTCQKFANDPLMTKLLDTGAAHLEETNTWGDTYWGVCNGIGKNNLGKILMFVREDLRAIQEQYLLDELDR